MAKLLLSFADAKAFRHCNLRKGAETLDRMKGTLEAEAVAISRARDDSLLARYNQRVGNPFQPNSLQSKVYSQEIALALRDDDTPYPDLGNPFTGLLPYHPYKH